MDKKTSDEFQGLGECVCFNLKRAARLVTRAYDEALRGTGLRATQFSILAVLSNAGPLGVSALAGVLGTERTTLTRNLKLLSQQRLVSIGPDPKGDKRAKRVAATTEGKKTLLRALPRWQKAQSEMLGHLGHERWKVMLGGLKKVLKMKPREAPGAADK